MIVRIVKLICATVIVCVGTMSSNFRSWQGTDAGLFALIFGGMLLLNQWVDPPSPSGEQSRASDAPDAPDSVTA
jgi:hypothetical protein